MSGRSKGEGTIRERTYTRADGSTYTRYAARVSVVLSTGGRRRVDGPYRVSKEEARRDLTRLTGQRDAHLIPTSTSSTGAYLLAWLEQKESELRPRTIATYRADLKHHVIPAIGKVRLDQLTPWQVQTLVTTLRQKHSVAVARKARAVLRAALEEAVRMELIPRNPVAAVPAPPAPARRGPPWTLEHARAFARACRDARHGRLYLLIMGTGLRAGEALGLRWQDTAPDAVVIRQQVMTVGRPVAAPPKTQRAQRTVAIGSDLAELLAAQHEHVANLRDHALRLGRPWVEHDLVFPNLLGGALRLENVRRDYLRTLARARVDDRPIPHARIHDLRHLHLTRMIAVGVDVDTVSRRAGHSRTSTTMDLYVHGDDAAQRRGGLTLEQLLGLPTELPTQVPDQDPKD